MIINLVNMSPSSYENPTAKKVETKTADGVVEGFYSYISPDGKIITNQYRADAAGFQSSLAPSNVNEVAPPAAVVPVVAVPDPVYVESVDYDDTPTPEVGVYQEQQQQQQQPPVDPVVYQREPAATYLADANAVAPQPQFVQSHPVLKGYEAVPLGPSLEPQAVPVLVNSNPLPNNLVRVEQRPSGIIEHQLSRFHATR